MSANASSVVLTRSGDVSLFWKVPGKEIKKYCRSTLSYIDFIEIWQYVLTKPPLGSMRHSKDNDTLRQCFMWWQKIVQQQSFPTALVFLRDVVELQVHVNQWERYCVLVHQWKIYAQMCCWDQIPRTCHVFTRLFTSNTPWYFLDFAL